MKPHSGIDRAERQFGPRHHHRDIVHLFKTGDVLAVEAVSAQLLTVIAGEDDDRVVEGAGIVPSRSGRRTTCQSR